MAKLKTAAAGDDPRRKPYGGASKKINNANQEEHGQQLPNPGKDRIKPGYPEYKEKDVKKRNSYNEEMHSNPRSPKTTPKPKSPNRDQFDKESKNVKKHKKITTPHGAPMNYKVEKLKKKKPEDKEPKSSNKKDKK